MNHGTAERFGSLPRCPFATAGLDSAWMASCPGFLAEHVDFTGVAVPGDYRGHPPRPGGTSCSHVVPTRSRRGMRPACSHPDGAPYTWTGGRELVGRRVGIPFGRPATAG